MPSPDASEASASRNGFISQFFFVFRFDFIKISVRPNLISVTFLPKISAENPFCFGRNHFAKATELSDSAEPGSFCRIIHFRQKIAVSAEYSSFCRHYLKVLESNRPFCCKISFQKLKNLAETAEYLAETAEYSAETIIFGRNCLIRQKLPASAEYSVSVRFRSFFSAEFWFRPKL